MTRILICGALIVVAAWLAAIPDEARGCASAPRAGEQIDVSVETALIVWDEATKTEHFIRQATFIGRASDFGFLVPTPNRPQIELVDSDLFADLARITEPRTEHRTETGIDFPFGCSSKNVADKHDQGLAIPSGVVVLEQKRVGDHDYAVLKFRGDKSQKPEDAADELLMWLKDNSYPARPELKEWLKVYIENTWLITAFKISGQAGTGEPAGTSKNVAVKASAVRMSFKTDRPFFPYREPADERNGSAANAPRSLRVFVAAKQRFAGTIGNALAWPGQTVWANAITAEERREILVKAKLPPETFDGKWWLTEFEDHSSPRPGTDELYFAPSEDRAIVARPARIITTFDSPWWLGPLAVLGVCSLVGCGVWLIRRTTSSDRRAEAARPKTQPAAPAKGQKSQDKEQRTDPGWA